MEQPILVMVNIPNGGTVPTTYVIIPDKISAYEASARASKASKDACTITPTPTHKEILAAVERQLGEDARVVQYRTVVLQTEPAA